MELLKDDQLLRSSYFLFEPKWVRIKLFLKYLGIPGMAFIIFGVICSGIVISIFNEIRYFSIPSTLLALESLMED